jgi:hypothetical protein
MAGDLPPSSSGHGRQVAGRGRHDAPPGLARAGEQQVIEGQCAERGPAAAAVIEEGELVGRKVLRSELHQQTRQMGRVLRHLDHGPVAGGEDSGQRTDREKEREVPRNDDADDAQRLADEPVLRQREHHPVDLAPHRPHPAPEMLDRVADAVEDDEELGEQRLESRAIAVVAIDGLDQRLLVLLEHARERLEVRDALPVARVRVGEIGLALARQSLLEFGNRQSSR